MERTSVAKPAGRRWRASGGPALALHQTELELARDPAMVRSLGRPPVLPVLDGVVLRTWPRDGTLLPVPLLIGTTRDEAVFWHDLVGPDAKRVPGLPSPADRAAAHRNRPPRQILHYP